MDTSPRRERRTIRRLTGALYAASGCLLLVNFCRCTSWGNAYPEGSPEWWIAVLGAMFQTSDARLINGALLVAFGVGIFHWIRGFLPEFRGLPTTTRGLMIAVAIVAVICVCLRYILLGVILLTMVLLAPSVWLHVSLCFNTVPRSVRLSRQPRDGTTRSE